MNWTPRIVIAAAVRKVELEMNVQTNELNIKNEPIFFEDGESGCEPSASAVDRVIG
jgi:hypothetical protein